MLYHVKTVHGQKVTAAKGIDIAGKCISRLCANILDAVLRKLLNEPGGCFDFIQYIAIAVGIG